MTQLEDQWGPHLPCPREIRELATQLFYEDHPEATTPEEYELRAPEGRYYKEAQRRIMAGYVRMLEQSLALYIEELREIVSQLRKVERIDPIII